MNKNRWIYRSVVKEGLFKQRKLVFVVDKQKVYKRIINLKIHILKSCLEKRKWWKSLTFDQLVVVGLQGGSLLSHPGLCFLC